MTGGEVSGNNNSGVYMNGGTFTMSGGEVSGNSSSTGGGVYVSNGNNTFTMQGSASVHDNIAKLNGGGVYLGSRNCIFAMKDNASLYGNTAGGNGGGLYVTSGTLNIGGGTIYGNIEADKSNTASAGAAMYIATVSGGRAEYGTVSGDIFSKNGSLATTDDTLDVANGILISGKAAQCIVYFDSNNTDAGSIDAVPKTKTIIPPAATIDVLPEPPLRSDYIFSGWNTKADGSGSVFTADTRLGDYLTNFTVYAQWLPFFFINVSSEAEWNAAVNTINSGSKGGTYTITILNDISIPGRTSSNFSPANLTVTIKGDKTISLSSKGSVLRISSGQNIIVQGIRFMGMDNNNAQAVFIDGGDFTMQDNAMVYGNSSYSAGGGVCLYSGTFTMNGGQISGNSSLANGPSSSGGGVYVSSGTFTMNGGQISGNFCLPSTSPISPSFGGGVCVNGGTFTMNGGQISGNSCSGALSYGGGVCVGWNSFFYKTGGTIFGYSEGDSQSNVVTDSSGVSQENKGHAVYVDSYDSNFVKHKETTSGPDDNLSYISTPYGTTPKWSGDWDF